MAASTDLPEDFQILTARLRLRPATLGDIASYTALFSVEANVRYEPQGCDPSRTGELLESWIPRIRKRESLQMLVLSRETGQVIGLTGFNALMTKDYREIYVGDAGILIDQQYVERGYGREVVEALLDWSLNDDNAGLNSATHILGRKLDLVYFETQLANKPFIDFMTRLGYHGEERTRAGVNAEEVIFKVSKMDWQASQHLRKSKASKKTNSSIQMQCELIPIDLHDAEQFEYLKQQRVGCGWDSQATKLTLWKDAMDRKEKTLFWIQLLDGFRVGHIAIARKSQHDIPEPVKKAGGSTMILGTFYVTRIYASTGIGRIAMDHVENLVDKEPYGDINCKAIVLDALDRRYLYVDAPEWLGIWGRLESPKPRLCAQDWYARRGYKLFGSFISYDDTAADGTKVKLSSVQLWKPVSSLAEALEEKEGGVQGGLER